MGRAAGKRGVKGKDTYPNPIMPHMNFLCGRT